MKLFKLFSSFLVLSLIFQPLPAPAAHAPQHVVSGVPETLPEITPGEMSPEAIGLPEEPTFDFLAASPLSLEASAEEEPPFFLGIEEGATVSGVVEIRPNVEEITGIKKVAYYLNGTKSGKVYQPPFIWGGPSGNGTAGFDTNTIPDGDYTLGMVYTDQSGDHPIEISFTVDNATVTPQPGDPNAFIWGVEQNETVSGVVEIFPNPERLFEGTEEVTWQLNDSAPVTVSEEPFMWGVTSGNGATGFDTAQLPDGVHQLRMSAANPQGDSVNAAITFVTENNSDTVPETETIAPSGRTQSGLSFPAGTLFVDIEERGDLSFLAGTHALYIVSHANASVPQLLSAIDFDFDPPLVDIAVSPDGQAVFVLERGPADVFNGTPDNPFYNGRLWRVDVSDPANPVRRLVQKGSSSTMGRAKGLTIQNGTLYVIFDEEHVLLPCSLDGSSCAVPQDIYGLRDLMELNAHGRFSAERGVSFIRAQGNVPGDFSDTPTPAPLAYLSEKEDRYLFTALENGTIEIYDTGLIDSAGQIPAIHSFALNGSDPVFSVIPENAPDQFAVLDAAGLIEIFDITEVENVMPLDSFTVPGARRLDFDGEHFFAVTANEFRILQRNDAPPPGGDSRVLGITEGATVSGVVEIRPNLEELPGIKKVAYYLNGTKSGKVYQSPFMWGGPAGDGTAGFDTGTLPEGDYELAMVYTDASGDHGVPIHFTVRH